ncbi:hypothetical protein BDV25DRAFT_126120 [Aspergillus avenaceus]|uniref:BZIP domain-containing protein n=1 Tax=Aspergillus avenaceus TaxID=36643 RepID=A0A5N6U9V9_ASPAV|nr:hypothetical protein BDV25DRAFT_126120 [Aspergillus avenaceus]
MARRQRKRVQNRLNQRARRLRLRENEARTARVPYQIHRWRVEASPGSGCHSASQGLADSRTNQDSLQSVDFFVPPRVESTLPADQLLHLIQLNVWRGFHLTKDLLRSFTASILPLDTNAVPAPAMYPGSSVIVATVPGLPDCLAPTELQMSRVHATWINLFPFPKMRDNLIAWEACFDHAEFTGDILGDTIDARIMAAPFSTPQTIASRLHVSAGDDELTTSRRGFILWGDSYNPENWEATPGFLRKWGWAVEGCAELIESSNRWRSIRGEEPMRVTLV